MPERHAIGEIVEAVRQHPQRWAQVSRQSALSLPVPVGGAGEESLAFFWYPVGGPAMNRTVGAPTHRVLAGLGRPDDITFLPIQATDLSLGAAPGAPLGTPRVGGPVPQAEMESLKAEFYGSLDSLLSLGLGSAPAPGDVPEVAASLHAQFHRLAVIALLPSYRALNPAFFDWLDYGRPVAP